MERPDNLFLAVLVISPKSTPFPVVKIVTYSITFDVPPPANTPLVEEEQAPLLLLVLVKVPKLTASPSEEIVTYPIVPAL